MTLSRSRTGGVSASAPDDQHAILADPADQMRRHPRCRGAPRRGVPSAGGSSPAPARSEREVGGAEIEVPRQRFVEHRRHAGRDDHAAGVDAAGGGEDVGGLAVEGDLLHRRAFEQPRAAHSPPTAARPRQARYGSIVAPSFARSAAAALSADLAGDRARVQQRRIDAAGAPRLLLALQARRPDPASSRP